MAKQKKTGKASAYQKMPFPHGVSLAGKGQPAPEKQEKRQEPGGQETDYYRLKYQAVEDLVTASPENSPPVSRQELRKFHAGPRVHAADWVKAILLKFWFAGVICYFFIWGLSTYALNQWDHLLILAIAQGGVTFLLTNNIYRFMAKTEGAYDRWMMFPGKSIVLLLPEILYAAVLILCTVMTYNGVNLAFAGGAEGGAALGVEPLLYGLFITLWDLLFLGVKHLLKRILADARQKVSEEKKSV